MTELTIECEEDFDVSPIEKAFAARISSNVPLAAELIFTDEEGIRSLNARERGKDAVTDVLSFPNLSGIFRNASSSHPRRVFRDVPATWPP